MKIIYKFFFILAFFILFGCQTIEKKSQATIEKENKKLEKFLQQPESELKIVMGEPDEIKQDVNGSKFLIYKKKNIILLVKENLKLVGIIWS
jgi:hypothetical protein